MTAKLTEQQIRAFLTELTELTRKHNIEICAGGPWGCLHQIPQDIDHVYGVRENGEDIIFDSVDYFASHPEYITGEVLWLNPTALS